MNFGGKHLQDKVVKDCLQGRKFICLAITEPYAGSDVAGLRTTAVKDPSGKFYIVNGEKKWCVPSACVSAHLGGIQLSAAAALPLPAQDHQRRLL